MLDTGTGINWYEERVMLVLQGATDAALEELALLVEGAAKRNIVGNDQVDTGFMLNSVYTVSRVGVNNYADAKSNAAGQAAGRQMAPEAEFTNDHQRALVAVGAEYGIHQEMRKGYLYPALVEAAAQTGAVIHKAAKEAGLR